LSLTRNNYLTVMTETLSIEVSNELRHGCLLRQRADRRSRSTLLREALELIVSDAAPKSKPSLYDLSRGLFENLGRKGPRDLSTNRKHLDDLGE
jgi:hypothetical protein